MDGLRGKADFLIIDLEGTASNLVTYAISQADLVLVPFEPTPMEARQAARAVQHVRNTGRLMNKTIAHALVLTRVNAAFQTSDEKDVRKETESADIPVLQNRHRAPRALYADIPRRLPPDRASGAGQGGGEGQDQLAAGAGLEAAGNRHSERQGLRPRGRQQTAPRESRRMSYGFDKPLETVKLPTQAAPKKADKVDLASVLQAGSALGFVSREATTRRKTGPKRIEPQDR